MIYVKGKKWKFKKRSDGSYRVSCLNKDNKQSFIYRPKEFNCKNLKKIIRRRMARKQ